MIKTAPQYHISLTNLSIQYNVFKRTHHKADTLTCPNFVIFWSNSITINLYKAYTSIKRILLYGLNGVRFKEIPLHTQCKSVCKLK